MANKRMQRKNPPKFRCQKCKQEFEGEYKHLAKALRHVKDHFRISQQEIIDGTPKLYTHYLEYWENGQWVKDNENENEELDFDEIIEAYRDIVTQSGPLRWYVLPRVKLDSPETVSEAFKRAAKYIAKNLTDEEVEDLFVELTPELEKDIKDLSLKVTKIGPIPHHITDPEDKSLPALQKSLENCASPEDENGG